MIETGGGAQPNGPLATTRAQSIADALRERILSGELPAGTRLRQNDVARSFSVSTTPVREAFVALQREGLLVGDAHRGVAVFRPTIEDFRENSEIRVALEALATERAVEYIGDDDIAELEELLARMQSSSDDFEYPELNRRFHVKIYRCARRPRLQQLIESLRQAAEAYMFLVAARSAYSPKRIEEHARIVAALRDRDARRAATEMREHLASSAAVIESELESSPIGEPE